MQVSQNKKIENENILNILWARYFPYWPLFGLLLILSIGGAWTYLRYATPVYESTANILINDEKKGIDESKMTEALNQLSTKKIIENEIEVIKSRTLMSEVVKRLHLYAPVFEEGKVKQSSAYSTSPIKVELQSPDSLIETEKVYFNYNPKDSIISINGKFYPINNYVKTDYGIIKFVFQQRSSASNKYPLFFSLINPKKVTEVLNKKLTVSPANKLSTVINLKIKDDEPKRSEDILNELVLAYNRSVLTGKNLLVSNTLSFLEERLKLVSHDLDSIEHKLQVYKSKKGAVDVGSQGRLFLENVSVNDQKLGDVSMQLAVLNQVENYVAAKDNKGGIVPSTLGVSDPLLTQLLDKLYDSELQYEKLKKTTGENNPMLVSLSDQISKIKPSIFENIQSQRRSLEAGKKNLYSNNGMYSSLLQSIPQKERDLVEINREQSIKSNLYTFLLQKREEAALSHSSTVPDARIIDKAQSSLKPVSPKKLIIYLGAIGLSLALGFAFVSGKEIFNRTILYRHEIEAYTAFPILGEIPFDKSKSPLVMGEGERTFASQQFRKLRASLSFMGLYSKRKKILITSTISGEGKSFIAANLGLSLAIAGKKVVLLELDLTNPSLSDKLNINAEKGASNYLIGECEPEEVIKRTDAHENLFIIPSGPLPNNPSELLINGKVQDLLIYLDGIFDYLIIDSAPVGPLSDAYILSPLCDATLYVIRHKHTPKFLIKRLDDNNKVNELKNIAIVFNGVRPRGVSKYGYGYGYGYIYNDKGQPKNKAAQVNNK